MGKDRGLVLVNALVIVLAISVVAASLLSLAAKGRARVGSTIVSGQMVLYLDAVQTLVPMLLEREWRKDGNDNLTEFWATQGYSIPIDRGTVAAQLTDQQGLLDVNLLAVPDEIVIGEFTRLFDKLKVPRNLLRAVIDYLSAGGPSQVVGYLDRPVPVLPVGGQVSVIEELRQVEGFDDATFARLAPFISALPDPAPLNVNTAPPEVLGAVLPNLRADQIADLIRDRKRNPYTSRLDFLLRAERLFGEEAMSTIVPERFAARSSHFAARLSARLDGGRLDRKVLFVRDDKNNGKTKAMIAFLVPIPVEGP